MSRLAIKGHETRGKEVIEILEMLGGKSYTALPYQGNDLDRYYYINKVDNYINAEAVWRVLLQNRFQVFTLEGFLEKFPHKVGDKVIDIKTGRIAEIYKAHWSESNNCTYYDLKLLNNTGFVRNYKFLQSYKEETMEEIKIEIPKGYEFAGVDNDKQQVVFTKVQSQYPKTYEECIGQLSINCDGEVKGYKCELLANFQKLLIVRDVYWKIAGEQMGLGKPWKPDFTNDDEERYGIYTTANKVVKDFCGVGDVNVILTFPTEEMRDAFFENFKELIEECKELL